MLILKSSPITLYHNPLVLATALEFVKCFYFFIVRLYDTKNIILHKVHNNKLEDYAKRIDWCKKKIKDFIN